MPLGIMPASGKSAPPMSEEDWLKRQQRLRELGASEDSLLMRGTEWRRGLAADREDFRDGLRQKLGLNAADTATKAAAAGGSSSLLSSL